MKLRWFWTLAVPPLIGALVFCACRESNSLAQPGEPAAIPPIPSPYSSARVEGVPHVRQKPDFCGEACAAMYLAKLGHRIDQDQVFNESGVDPELGRGCHTRELARVLGQIGFQVGRVWFTASPDRADTDLEKLFSGLHADLRAGIPSIVCMRYDESPNATEHFRLILGFDQAKDAVIYHEPAESGGGYREMERKRFLALWPLKYSDREWTVIRMRLVPGEIKKLTRPKTRFTAADYAQQVIKVRSQAVEGFEIIIQKPFVVAGDGPLSTTREIARDTIGWAVTRLKQEYFSDDPAQIICIWLFKDEESYRKNAERIWGDAPDTPFGYYSHRHQALVMNIDTGTGTLVHELVHPFIATNFPECPSWFNEGLASLYEQCGDNRGHIWGRTNWRLKGLQEIIEPPKPPEPEAKPEPTDRGAAPPGKDGASSDAATPGKEPPSKPPVVERRELAPFKVMCGTSDSAFYYADRGSNYAQARYLCYYLQQQGLLRKFYHQFRKDVQSDPTGYATLKSVLGISDEAEMEKFFQKWKDWVMQLRYP